ncbi:hypothetical protein Fcan01_08825 [Folsomia candida]|uniref:C2H2-type domain-containing protein n=1 Tax=Folsomia candida TaxID=158441 RepID=A0A226ECA6_FOLCA|nr:hypothetical protein Fcan01_08825 [Folsomia candida]
MMNIATNFILLSLTFFLRYPHQVQGDNCFVCNPIMTFVPLQDGTISFEDLLDAELSSYTKDKGTCVDMEEAASSSSGSEIRKNSKFTQQCLEGCAYGQISDVKYRIHMTHAQSDESKVETTKVVVVADGEFRSCFKQGEMVMKNDAALARSGPHVDCGDHEAKNKSGADTLHGSLQVNTVRLGGTVEACGCQGDFCNKGTGAGFGANSGLSRVDIRAAPHSSRDKPQGWTAAQLEKQGKEFSCYRCQATFRSEKERAEHMVKDKKNACPKYVETVEKIRNIAREAVDMRPEDRPHVNPPHFEDDIDELDPPSLISEINHLKRTLPTFNDLGRIDFNDIPEVLRRHEEFLKEENVKARARGEKVIYSWSS